MTDTANHVFLPWVQPQALATLPDQHADTLSSDQPASAALRVALTMNSATVQQVVALYGPADVTGVDPDQVVRFEPSDRARAFEPNYFPFIEFDRPDFPWLFTPARAGAQSRLRPWLALVVIRVQDGVQLRPGEGARAPVLTIQPPATPGDELPDLAESHFWAHAQVTGAAPAGLKQVIDSDPARTLSRLVCPRHLRPNTEYLACVVPAFEAGRLAGLGLAVPDGETLQPAWQSGPRSPSDIELPVYLSWTFRTGDGGDFEELVRRLKPLPLPAGIGKQPIDVSRPGFVITPVPAAGASRGVIGFEGALRVANADPDPWPDAGRVPFQTALADILDTPWKLAQGANPQLEPIVAPPIYGEWHAALHAVSAATPPALSFWLNELNLDPRRRLAAALGAAVVQKDQEALMAAAWAQLGDITAINQRLRQGQLSREINGRYHATMFARLAPETFMRVVAPAQSRIAIPVGPPDEPAVPRVLVSKTIAQSFVPATAVSAAVRRITRPRGAINRQYVQAGVAGVQAIIGYFNTPDTPSQPDPARRNPDAVTVDWVSQHIQFEIVRDHTTTPPTEETLVWNPLPVGHWERPRAELPSMIAAFRLDHLWSTTLKPAQPPSVPADFSAAALAHQQYLSDLFSTAVFRDGRQKLALQQMMASALDAMAPDATIAAGVHANLRITSPPMRSDDALEPIMDAPSFPQAMYEPLRSLSNDYLFPDLAQVPSDSIHLLQTNARFIESFMVGLNHEMARELLWRGYPTDQRGTYFQQFWDPAPAGTDAQPDIPPIHRWGAGALGTIATHGGDRLVLLVRGELLRRYPGTLIYAVKAILHNGRRVLATDFPAEARSSAERHPLFRGTLDPDVTFVGFDLTRDQAVADTGWFFVLQQQPTEPRFGLDSDPFGVGESGQIPELRTWNDLNWAHMAGTPDALDRLSHVPVNPLHLVPTQPVKAAWGRNAAHMASITKQRPVRVAIHATDLLPPVDHSRAEMP